MLYPTIDELTRGKFNRYELSLATAKCARIITNEYVRQREEAERAVTGNKETDRPINTMIDRELRDDKAVKIAIRKIYEGEYIIVRRPEGYYDQLNAEEENAAAEVDAVSEISDETDFSDETETEDDITDVNDSEDDEDGEREE